MELLQSLDGHTGRVWNVKWHPMGTALASCGEDRTIRIWGYTSKNLVLKTVLQDGHTKTIREVSWSPCGKYLASASFDATTALWDNISGEFECNATLEGHENEVKSVSWSKSGHFLATCSRDKSVWVWEVENDEYECAAVLNAHVQDVKKIIWHPNIDVIASASYDNTIKLFREDPSDSEWINFATLQSHESTVWSIAFDSTGTRLVSCSDDKTVKIWKEYLKTNEEGVSCEDPMWKCICTLSGYHLGPVYDVAWCHNTGLIATASGDNAIRIFKEAHYSNPEECWFELLCSIYNAHEQDVNSISWHPTQNFILASGSDDSSIKIWKVLESG